MQKCFFLVFFEISIMRFYPKKRTFYMVSPKYNKKTSCKTRKRLKKISFYYAFT